MRPLALVLIGILDPARQALADKYGVALTTVNHTVKYRTWRPAAAQLGRVPDVREEGGPTIRST